MVKDVTPSSYMSNSTICEPLEKLRADLRHFEDTTDFGENAAVLEIKSKLLRRIATLESALLRSAYRSIGQESGGSC
jgi:hypothetical protein